MSPEQPALHPELKPIEFLVGSWHGNGAGSYPGSQPFEYEEDLSFTHTGGPLLVYSMRTRHPGSGSALHSELGFLKCTSGGEIHAVIAHATGHVEVSRGSVEAGSVDFASTSIGSWGDADQVVSLKRHLTVSGDLLNDSLQMQAMGEQLQAHVAAELRRV